MMRAARPSEISVHFRQTIEAPQKPASFTVTAARTSILTHINLQITLQNAEMCNTATLPSNFTCFTQHFDLGKPSRIS